jgi:hypothetical protein
MMSATASAASAQDRATIRRSVGAEPGALKTSSTATVPLRLVLSATAIEIAASSAN